MPPNLINGNNMKVIIDARMLNASGIGTYIRNLIKIIHDNNIIELHCIINKEQLPQIKRMGITSYTLFNSRFFSPLEQLEYLFKLPKGDVLWTPHFNAPLLPLFNRFKKRVVTIHDMYPYAFKSKFNKFKFKYIDFLMRNAVSKSEQILTVSCFSKSEIIKFLKVDAKKIHVTPLGADPDFIPMENISRINGKKIILCVGNVKPHKNLKRAILAFNNIANQIPDYKLVIVGKREGFDSPEIDLEKIITDSSRIEFTGYVTFEKLREYYSTADILLFPSLYEGFGLPILEAMAFNLQIVASNRASIPEVGSDAIVYFNPESIAEIEMALQNVVSGKLNCDVSKYSNILMKNTWIHCAEKTLYALK